MIIHSYLLSIVSFNTEDTMVDNEQFLLAKTRSGVGIYINQTSTNGVFAAVISGMMMCLSSL